jgi:hypothetical protein
VCTGKNSSIQSGNGCYNNSKRKVNYILLSYVFQMSSSGDCRIYVIYIYFCCFVCTRVCSKTKYCYYLQSLFSLVSIVLLSVIVVLLLNERNRKERKRELYHFYSLFFLRVRPFCPSFKQYKQYLYTYTRTRSHTDVIGGRNIKSYTHIHSSICPSIALDLSFVSSSHI